jgi:hypothetical protein
MPWLVGIDEAGYGPNLGPLVMSAVACRVPDGLARTDLWSVLASAVRREGERHDGRPLVADSKVVHSGPHGLAALEVGVLGSVRPEAHDGLLTLHRYLGWLSPTSDAELSGETWYSGQTALPSATTADGCAAAAAQFGIVCRGRGLEWGSARSVVVCPARFNQITEAWGSKGAVLGEGLTELVRWAWDLAGDDAVLIMVDKHGGRNTYAPMLQNAVPAGMIVAEREGMQRSTYRLLGGPRPMGFTFQPRADSEHFLVALASMVSKYLRELLMGEFNAFWQQRVPGLKPTAGYPGDAMRFLDAIRPKVAELGLAEATIWRCR